MIFRNWVLQNFPFLEDDFDALTDYELFCKMVEYMKKSLDKVKEYQTQLNEFRTELDTYKEYFDNLDVQEEINNKLDEMADSGELTDIIAQYLQLAGVLAYDTLSDLEEALNIVNGSICKTLGQNSYSDGLGAFYRIRHITVSDIIDNITIIPLEVSDTLIAEKIINYDNSDNTNPLYYGADPTGTIDSSNAINNCIENNKGKSINFSSGIYLVNDTINLPFKNDEKVNINGNGAKIIVTDEVDKLFFYGYDRVSNEVNDVGFICYIKDLSINGENGDITDTFYINKGFKDLHILNVEIYRTTNAIRIGETTGAPADTLIDNCLFYGKGSEYDGTGIISNCSDNYISNTRIYGFRKGFIINGGCIINTTHVLLRWSNQTSANFDPIPRNTEEFNSVYELTKFAEINDITRLYGCYADSVYKFLDIITNGLNVILTNSFYYNARDNVNCRIIHIHGDTTNLICTNNVFQIVKNNQADGIKLDNTLTNYSQIKIENNDIQSIGRLTNSFDLIRNENFKYKVNNTFPADTWCVIGLLTNCGAYNNGVISLYINSWFYKIRFNDNNGTIDTLTQLLKSNSTTNYSFGILSDGTNKYLCVKSSSAASSMKFTFNIENTSNIMFGLSTMLTGYSPVDTPILLSNFTDSVPEKTVALNISIGQ